MVYTHKHKTPTTRRQAFVRRYGGVICTKAHWKIRPSVGLVFVCASPVMKVFGSVSVYDLMSYRYASWQPDC